MKSLRHKTNRPRSQQGGFTMIEVLVALVVLAIGLLATAQLQALSLQRNNESLFRTQATNLGYEIMDQLRATRQIVVGGDPTNDQMDRFEELVTDRLPAGQVDIQVAADLVTITLTWIDDRTQSAAAQGDPDARETSFVIASRI